MSLREKFFFIGRKEKVGESIMTLSDLILKLIRFPLSSSFFLISPSERNRFAD